LTYVGPVFAEVEPEDELCPWCIAVYKHELMVASHDDYLWFEQRFPDLAEAYCVTLVAGETASGLLDRLGGVGDRVNRVGVGGLLEPPHRRCPHSRSARLGRPARIMLAGDRRAQRGRAAGNGQQ